MPREQVIHVCVGCKPQFIAVLNQTGFGVLVAECRCLRFCIPALTKLADRAACLIHLGPPAWPCPAPPLRTRTAQLCTSVLCLVGRTTRLLRMIYSWPHLLCSAPCPPSKPTHMLCSAAESPLLLCLMPTPVLCMTPPPSAAASMVIRLLPLKAHTQLVVLCRPLQMHTLCA